ncbi:hypothetical protein GDO86_005010 [Hymenochirus boettgeri]|uniref:Cystine/glutamate transporter n=1 Tax=Hymenochirus boettgeri TaxID=247094 RepID=A0A8T2J0B7_9PIPI|nr:hypothetical protein GDO86_005010 [Hymenochirus boettgeri]
METSQPRNGDNKKGDGVVYLRRKITLLRAISLTIGSIIGSGIFISPKGVLKNSGNVGLSLVIWVAGGLLSMCGALSYADLSTSIKKSGGCYIYLLETLGPLPAFLRVYVEFVIIRWGKTENFQDAFDTNSLALDKIPLAFYSSMFAYGGWKIPIAVIVSMSVVTVCYLLTNVAYYTVNTSEVLGSDAVVCQSRGSLAPMFSMIHIRRHTPLPALLLMVPLSIAMVSVGDLYALLHFCSFARWVFMGLVTLGLMVHRYRFPDRPQPFKVPLIIPFIFTTMCLFIVGMSLYSDPVNTGIGCAITLSGLPVYYVTVYKWRLPRRWRETFNLLTMKLQVLMEVIPQEIPTY